MIVTYQGQTSFKISQGSLSVCINPTSKTAADLTLFTTGRSDTSEKSGFVVFGPGEYEVKDISVKGFLSKGKSERINTIYMVNLEGMNICFLGSLADADLDSSVLEQLEDIDILFVPVGGDGVLDSTSGYKLSVKLEPALIIPMHYNAETLKKFIKEAGEDKVEAIDKLVIKKKDLEGKEGEIVVLKEE